MKVSGAYVLVSVSYLSFSFVKIGYKYLVTQKASMCLVFINHQLLVKQLLESLHLVRLAPKWLTRHLCLFIKFSRYSQKKQKCAFNFWKQTRSMRSNIERLLWNKLLTLQTARVKLAIFLSAKYLLSKSWFFSMIS